MWEGGTNEEIRISNEALFKGVSTQVPTRFGLRTIDKYIDKFDDNLDFSFVNPSKIFVWGA
jgi:hypothetical protein